MQIPVAKKICNIIMCELGLAMQPQNPVYLLYVQGNTKFYYEYEYVQYVHIVSCFRYYFSTKYLNSTVILLITFIQVPIIYYVQFSSNTQKTSTLKTEEYLQHSAISSASRTSTQYQVPVPSFKNQYTASSNSTQLQVPILSIK